MKVATWNCKVNRPAAGVLAGVRSLIKEHDPDVICLQEAGGYITELRAEFKKGWRIYAKKGWDESNWNPVMVRRRYPQKRYRFGWGVVRMKMRWTGPKGGEHPGRTWTWVVVEEFVIMSLHRVTGGRDQNAAQFKEEAAALTAWVNGRKERVIVIGDHNCSAAADYPGTTQRVADNTNGHLIAERGSGSVDYALARGVRGTFTHSEKYGSDHESGILRVTE